LQQQFHEIAKRFADSDDDMHKKAQSLKSITG